MSGFRRRRNALLLSLDPIEAGLIRSLLDQVIELLEEKETSPDSDPLAAAVGIGTATELPEDLVLARLLPNAYGDDPAAAADFRRYTEKGLRSAKVTAARSAQSTLDQMTAEQGQRAVRITDGEADNWLRALTDIRLALGTRIGVTDDEESEPDVSPGDARAASYAVYQWLGYVQETLVEALPSPSVGTASE
jgi:hypothetical protein